MKPGIRYFCFLATLALVACSQSFDQSKLATCKDYVTQSYDIIENEPVININLLKIDSLIHLENPLAYNPDLSLELIVSPKGALYLKLNVSDYQTEHFFTSESLHLRFDLIADKKEYVSLPMVKMKNSSPVIKKFYIKLSDPSALNWLGKFPLKQLAILDKQLGKEVLILRIEEASQAYFQCLLPCLKHQSIYHYVATAYYPNLYE